MSILCNRIKWTIEDAFDGLRQRIQRFRRGFSWFDVWNMDSWFIETVEPMLRHLAEHADGYDDTEFESLDEWKSTLLHMADLLHNMSEDNLIHDRFYGYENYYVENDMEIQKIVKESHDEFFKLFSKHFYDLWD